MKRILAIILVLTTVHSYAQFSIRRNADGHSIDILYTAPPSGQGVHPVQFFEFALQATNPNGSLTATFTPGAPLTALPSFVPAAGNGRTTDASGLQTFAWASAGVPNYSNTYNFPATEVVLGTVSFSGPYSGAIVNAIDYQGATPYGGTATEQAVWTMQINSSGTEVTNYSSLFYQSQPAGGIPGSLAPATVTGQGASNQSLSLAATPLPLKLLSFTASKQAGNTNSALVSWTVAEQVNTKSFEVERSANGANYSKIGTVAAAGNYAGKQSYSFTDVNAANGTNYYRLKMVDIDGEFTYSPVKTVRFDGGAAENVYLSPNPTRGEFHVKGLTATSVVRVLDMNGKVLQTYNGVNTYTTLNIVHLPAAVYIVQVIQDAQLSGTYKLIKE